MGVIRSAGRKPATVTEERLPYDVFQSVRLHFGLRNMGAKNQGDTVAALLASKLILMDVNMRCSIYTKLGLSGMPCREVAHICLSVCSHPQRRDRIVGSGGISPSCPASHLGTGVQSLATRGGVIDWVGYEWVDPEPRAPAAVRIQELHYPSRLYSSYQLARGLVVSKRE